MTPDPFHALVLPPTFDLTRDAIERAYLAASRRLHPDLVDSAPEAQAAAQTASAQLNRAAATLRDPESRATALLAHLAGPSKEADKSLPDGFLQDILDVRMEIENARGDPAARDKWETWAQDQRQTYAATCSELFPRATATTPADPATLRDIRRTLNAWRYIERLIEQLDPDYNPARADFRRHP